MALVKKVERYAFVCGDDCGAGQVGDRGEPGVDPKRWDGRTFIEAVQGEPASCHCCGKQITLPQPSLVERLTGGGK